MGERPKPVNIEEQRRIVEPFRCLKLHASHLEALDDLEATRRERDELAAQRRYCEEVIIEARTERDAAQHERDEEKQARIDLANFLTKERDAATRRAEEARFEAATLRQVQGHLETYRTSTLDGERPLYDPSGSFAGQVLAAQQKTDNVLATLASHTLSEREALLEVAKASRFFASSTRSAYGYNPGQHEAEMRLGTALATLDRLRKGDAVTDTKNPQEAEEERDEAKRALIAIATALEEVQAEVAVLRGALESIRSTLAIGLPDKPTPMSMPVVFGQGTIADLIKDVDTALASTTSDTLLAERYALRDDLEESEKLRGRLAELLVGVATALKGPPNELMTHDWSDLPAVAASVMAEVDALREVLESNPDHGRHPSGESCGTPWCKKMYHALATRDRLRKEGP